MASPIPRIQALGGRLLPWLWQNTVTNTNPSWASSLTKYKSLGSRLFSVAADAAPSSSSAAAGATKPPFKPSPFAFVMFIPSVLSGYLAYWQYERYRWKEGLIKLREEKLRGEPVSVYELKDMEDYQKVSCSGRYMHDRSIFVGPRPRSIPGYGIKSGYFLITPLFDPVRRGVVMVNRGWVPASWLDDIQQVAAAHDAKPDASQQLAAQPASPAAQPSSPARTGWFGQRKEVAPKTATPAAPEPSIQVVGVLQPSEQPSAVLPDNVPEKLEFHWVDVQALASAVGLPSDTPLVQAISDDVGTQQQQKSSNVIKQARQAMPGFGGPPEYPIPKNTRDLVHFTTMPKDHLIYAGIWVSLVVALGLMARQTVFFPPKMYRMVNHGSNKDLWQAMRNKKDG